MQSDKRIWEYNKLNLSNDEYNKLSKAKSDRDELIILFKIIKSRGWIHYDRTQGKSDGLLGNVFEDLIGVKENNIKGADYYSYEIKTKNDYSSASLVSLFGYCIGSIPSANTSIREEFGVVDDKSFKKIFNSTVKYMEWNNHRGGHNFKLERNQDKLYLRVKKTIDDYSVDNDRFYWEEDEIERRFCKIKNVCYVEGEIDTKFKRVKYNKMTLYEEANFDKFWELIKTKDIVMDFRIGVYRVGKNAGKSHDHGSGFRIKANKIPELFESKKEFQ